MLLCFLVVISFCILTIAQDFSVPQGWRESTSNRSREDRANISQTLIDTAIPLFDGQSGEIGALQFSQSANMLCGIALHDLIAGTNENRATVLTQIQKVSSQRPGFFTHVVNEPVNWGLAAFYAYRAYGNQSMLQMASSVWDNTSAYMVSQDNAASGSHPLRNVSFSSECNGISVAGGLFYHSYELSEVYVNGATTAAFMVLSAYLFEVTNNVTYGAAANLSAQFIHSQLYNGAIILDGMDLKQCITGSPFVTDNSGFYIEGLSVYANVTKNETWTALLNSLISTTIKFAYWTGVNGVITEVGSDDLQGVAPGFGFKAIFIRGLYEAWSRNPGNADARMLIQSYVMVQYNALLDLASAPQSLYSPNWSGPPVSQLLPWGQLAAIDVLNSALGIPPANSSTSSTLPGLPTTALPTPTNSRSPLTPLPTSTTQTASAHGHSRTNLLVGVVVGILVLVLILAIVFMLRRRRHNRCHRRQPRESEFEPIPYNSTSAETPPLARLVQPASCILSRLLALPQRKRRSLRKSSGTDMTQSTLSNVTDIRSRMVEPAVSQLPEMILSIPISSSIARVDPESVKPPSSSPPYSGTRQFNARTGIPMPLLGPQHTTEVNVIRRVDAQPEPPALTSSPDTQTRSVNRSRPEGMQDMQSAPGGEPASLEPENMERFAELSDLIQQLNRLVSRLPPGGIPADPEEAPPRYEG